MWHPNAGDWLFFVGTSICLLAVKCVQDAECRKQRKRLDIRMRAEVWPFICLNAMVCFGVSPGTALAPRLSRYPCVGACCLVTSVVVTQHAFFFSFPFFVSSNSTEIIPFFVHFIFIHFIHGYVTELTICEHVWVVCYVHDHVLLPTIIKYTNCQHCFRSIVSFNSNLWTSSQRHIR